MQVANQTIEISRREKEDMATKLSQAERMLADGKHSMQKLEDDNSRLRRALEQSMTTVNRMSLDSDNAVDRLVIIALSSVMILVNPYMDDCSFVAMYMRSLRKTIFLQYMLNCKEFNTFLDEHGQTLIPKPL